jgi:hypothetical protein
MMSILGIYNTPDGKSFVKQKIDCQLNENKNGAFKAKHASKRLNALNVL